MLQHSGVLRQSLPRAVPSLLYVFQNSLQFLAIQYLDATVFSIMSQLKVLTTAICSVLILGTRLSVAKWRALLLLVVGCVLVQYLESNTAAPTTNNTSMVGLAAVLGMVCLSGLAGISVERALKASSTLAAGTSSDGAEHARPATLWERNVQLSLYGLLFGFGSAVSTDWASLSTLCFFHGFSFDAWFVMLVAAADGLIVAVVVKYTNTIVKGFATSLSIVLTSVVSLLLFPHVQLTFLFWLGAVCVLIAMFNYNEEQQFAPAGTLSSHTQQTVEVAQTPIKVSADKDSCEQEEWVRETEQLLPDIMDDVPNVLRDVRLLMEDNHKLRA